MKFHLYSNGERSLISDETPNQINGIPPLHRDGPFELRAKPIDAPDWLAAKEAFGFELSGLQGRMLAAAPAARADIQRREAP